MTDAIPTQIGKYNIVELVGEGAMGTVYRAVDSVLGRTVAVKVMNASIARQPDHRQRFLREAQAAGSLQHPNVVTIFDLGELDGHLFIAMEFLHGTDLEKLMVGAEPLKLQSKLDIIVDVLMGLSYAHKQGIIHRDIKPPNIRVLEDGHAKIMDFGVAHLASSEITRTGIVVGTPSYMAPEQVTGGKAVPGTDLFAAGAVLYHLLSGSKPFDGPTLQSLFYRIVTDTPRSLDELKPGLPPALNRIVQKALEKDPADRYGSALEMANDIIAVRAGLSGNSYASTASLASAVSVVQNYAPKPVPIERERKFGGKQIAIAGATAAILLIGWLAYGGSSAGVPKPATSTSGDSAAAIVSAPDSVRKPSVTAPVPASITVESTTTVSPAPKPAEAKPDESAKLKREAAARERAAREARAKEQARQAAKAASRNRADKPAATPPQVSVPQPSVVQPPVHEPPPRAVVIAPPATSTQVKPVEPSPAPRPAPREEVATAVAAYARAIESRDIGAVRRAYPGITSEQARGFEQFFQASRSINVTFRVTDLDTNGNSAEARLVGSYEYVTTEGKTQRQPVSFGASLRYEGSAWRLVSVR